LADAVEVFASIKRNSKVKYTALTPNEHGWNRALAAGVDEIAILTAASETFCERNTNTSISGSLLRSKPIIEHALSCGVGVRGYISCVIACPYEGEIDATVVCDIVEKMQAMGIRDIALGETIGVAVPTDICRLYDAIEKHLPPPDSILHLHDTRGTALACVFQAMQCGVTRFDASCGGLGGCPYAPGAAGNLATEDLVYFAHRMGVDTGIDLDALIQASAIVERELGCTLSSRTYQALQDAHIRPSE